MQLKFTYLIALCLALFGVAQNASLEAGGWKKNGQVFDFQGTKWEGMEFDFNGLQYTVMLPNSGGGRFQSGMVYLDGKLDKFHYTVGTSQSGFFNPPKTEAEFVKMIQDANKECSVTAINRKSSGAKYCVVITPLTAEYNVHWCFLCTEKHLIRMGSDDTNTERRLKFFESIKIPK